LLAVLIAGILAGIYLRSNRPSHPKTGIAKQNLLAPDFVLPQLDGTPLRLSDYRGKVVLLDFWATWCDPCREETPHFIELEQEYADRGLQIIGVSMDDTSSPVREFYEQFHVNYPLVMGDAKTGEAYGGVLGLPIIFLLDRDGRIVAKHMGSTKAEAFDREIAALLPKQ
jgi:thiol-disulfide isomerase/thioredoxin